MPKRGEPPWSCPICLPSDPTITAEPLTLPSAWATPGVAATVPTRLSGTRLRVDWPKPRSNFSELRT